MIEEIKSLYRTDKIVFIMLALYCGIFAGFFILDTDLHRDILYLSLPFSTWLIYKNAAFLKNFFLQHKISLLLIAAYLSYMALSLFWSDIDEEGRGFDKGKILLFLPLSMTGLFLIARKTQLAYPLLVYSFVFSAFFSAIYLLASHVFFSYSSGQWLRLEGIGRAENSVMAAYLYALGVLAIMYAKPLAQITWQHRVIIAFALFCVILFSLSRGPLLAFCVAVGGMMVFKKQYKRIACGTVIAVIAAISILSSGMRDQIPIANRGDTGRPQVWAQAIDKIAEKPIFGHGIASKFDYEYGQPNKPVQHASHPHSVYFGTLVQGGIVSLAILLAIMTIIFLKSLQLHRVSGEGWPLAVFISFATLGLYDFGGVYVNLGVVWIAFWFQYALIMAREKPESVL